MTISITELLLKDCIEDVLTNLDRYSNGHISPRSGWEENRQEETLLRRVASESSHPYVTFEILQIAKMGYNDAQALAPRDFWQFRYPDRTEDDIRFLQEIYGIGYDIGRKKLQEGYGLPLPPLKTVKVVA